jgi:hypothetical protein
MFPPSSGTLKFEAVGSSESSASSYHTARRHIQEDREALLFSPDSTAARRFVAVMGRGNTGAVV